MPFTVFVIGPAGAGKSTFVANFAEWMRGEAAPLQLLNLDPAAEYLPYIPDVDVREYIVAKDLMDRYSLGPNGAIIAAIDLTLNYVDRIQRSIEVDEGYVIVDTPGQMEIFAFRHTGENIIRELCVDGCAVVFLMDSVLSTTPASFISQLFLAASALYRLKLPQVNVLNKIDLLAAEEINRIGMWCESVDRLLEDLEAESRGAERLLSRGLLSAVSDFLGSFRVHLVSSKLMRGFEGIYTDLQAVYRGGEDFEMPGYLRETG